MVLYVNIYVSALTYWKLSTVVFFVILFFCLNFIHNCPDITQRNSNPYSFTKHLHFSQAPFYVLNPLIFDITPEQYLFRVFEQNLKSSIYQIMQSNTVVPLFNSTRCFPSLLPIILPFLIQSNFIHSTYFDTV